MEIRGLIGIELMDAFAAGMYLLFGVINLDLWLKRPDRPSHLWLAGASGGALMVDLSGMALRRMPITSGILPACNTLGVAVVMISLLQLVLSLSRRRSSPLTRAVYVLALIIALLGGLGGITQMVPLLLLLCGGVLIEAMILAFRAGRAGDRELRAITAGLLVLLLSLILDVLRELSVIHAAPGIPIIGFAGMFLVSASSLNSRYEREHRELIALRLDLERRVSERTRELEEANSLLAETSRTDALTGLPNRRGFFEVMNQRLDHASGACSLVMLDLDHFKEINDRYGHAAGDEVLQTAASLLRSVLGPNDLIARWGGEEFIVLLPDTVGEDAVSTAETIRRALSFHSFERSGAIERITASFGVAIHHPGNSLDSTIAAADQALYRAKEAGRDCVVAWE